MSLLVRKNDIMELVCKFKGHMVPNENLQELQKSQDENIRCICERCNFEIVIKIDPEDPKYYLISDYE